MNKAYTAAAVLAFTGGIANAGGVDRSGQSISALFEDGNYVELSFGSVNPTVSGVVTGTALSSGDMAASYQQFGSALKFQINDRFSFAVIADQPFGADVSYPASAYPLGAGTGAQAALESFAITGVARYALSDRISVHGGLRYQNLSAEVAIPAIANYTATGERDYGVGYLVGATYEIPDIALRVSLTYNSSIEHNLSTRETSLAAPGGLSSNTQIDAPESVNLDFQTGIAQNTLLFGSVRWVNWSEFDISPGHYTAITTNAGNPTGSQLVSYADDTITYTLGVGRKFNENWSGSLAIAYEDQVGGFASNLGPTDGKLGLTLGARYTYENITVSAGINYTEIGDANTVLARHPGTGAVLATSDFSDNYAIGAGFRIGFHF
ncbi:OmpP1/FadL family transporter [Cochlodiniinecator piscidefendens]|uniref:OmpP1/FadL family transporter n=1 Tax=Cochlodiniinecator piscidefendens TaxID=2715756 RepID=UPI00140A6F5C|nr:outer membrane protein transport protein [Cochlodiniinecator piscidefendens]